MLADFKAEVTTAPTPSSDSGSETTDTAVLVTKFAVTLFRHEVVLFRADQISDSRIALRKISNAHVLSLIQPFPACAYDHARVKISITTTAVASRSKEIDGASSATPFVLAEAASMALLHKRNWLQAMHDLQKARNVVIVDASLQMWCIIGHDGRPITETRALEMRNITNKVVTIERHDSLLVAILK